MIDQSTFQTPNPSASPVTVVAEPRGSAAGTRYGVGHEHVDGNRGRDTRDGARSHSQLPG